MQRSSNGHTLQNSNVFWSRKEICNVEDIQLLKIRLRAGNIQFYEIKKSFFKTNANRYCHLLRERYEARRRDKATCKERPLGSEVSYAGPKKPKSVGNRFSQLVFYFMVLADARELQKTGPGGQR